MFLGWDVYKVAVSVPESHLQAVMDTLDGVVTPIYPGYDHVFSWWPVKGCWRPLEGSDPYDGTVGQISVADEVRVEFAVREEDLRDAVEAVVGSHPYEEPAIDVIPMVPWKSVTGTDGSCRYCRRSSASCGS